MKTIVRSSSPMCLSTQPKSTKWRDFMSTDCHGVVHNNLRNEQQGLCCYCELEVQSGDCHIEHMEPRSKNPARTYDYYNLSISCNGGQTEHCGHYKDNKSGHSWDAKRFLPPHDPITASLFQYFFDGTLTATHTAPEKAAYLIGYLGLDCPRLTDRRRAHARMLIDTLGDQPDSELADWLREEYLHADTNNLLRQFYTLTLQILEP